MRGGKIEFGDYCMLKLVVGLLKNTPKLAFGGAVALGLAACTPDFNFGPTTSNFGTQKPTVTGNLAPATGEVLGDGPVRVVLLAPLSGDGGLGNVGISLRNGAKLAIDKIQGSPQFSSNIHLVVKDTGGSAVKARAAATQAVSEGASLILGPLRSDSVRAAGSVARTAGIPLIGFSNNTGASAPGIYLLNVLPETEVLRSVKYAQNFGRKSFAAIVPRTDFGQIQEGAFRVATANSGAAVHSIYQFSNELEARSAVEQLVPFLLSGSVDAIFLPDRATAPSIAVLFEAAQIEKTDVTIIGSADWDGDVKISQTPFLTGAFFPAVDSAGYERLKPEYEATYSATPHPMATFAYTAVLLANSSSLANATPRYDRNQLTRPSGFAGQDGVFRFLDNGTNQHALVMKQVVIDGSRVVDSAKMP